MDILVLIIVISIIGKLVVFNYKVNSFFKIDSKLDLNGSLISDEILDLNNLKKMFVLSSDIYLGKYDIDKNIVYLNEQVFNGSSISGIVAASVFSYIAVIMNNESDNRIKSIYKYLPYILLILLLSFVWFLYSLLVINVSFILISLLLMLVIINSLVVVYNIYKESCLMTLSYLKRIMDNNTFLRVSEYIKYMRMSFILHILYIGR